MAAHQNIIIFSCSKCPKRFGKFCQLFQHNLECHLKGVFKCRKEMCDFIGQYQIEGYLHSFAVHETTTISCPAEQCSEEFAEKEDLVTHADCTHPQLGWECPVCPAEFTKIADLINHIEHSHSEMMFVDEIPEYSEIEILNFHKIGIHVCQKTKHGKAKRNQLFAKACKYELLQCSVCKKEFPDIIKLQIHKSHDHGINPYVVSC